MKGTRPCPTLKVPFATRRDALVALRDLKYKQQLETHQELRRVYECPWCEQFHLTRSEERAEAS